MASLVIGTSVAGLANAAVGAGLLGLGGLGLASVAGGRRGRGRSGRGRGRSGRGHGRSGRGRRFRGRRSVVDDVVSSKAMMDKDKKEDFPEKKEVMVSRMDQVMMDEEQLLAAIRDSDEAGCGFRLVCELAGFSPDDLTEDELEIMDFVQFGDRKVAQGSGVLPNSPALADYQAAARLGVSGFSCASIYSNCEQSAQQLMNVISLFLH